MKQIIMDVLKDMSNDQINLASETARETVSSLISAALKAQGYNNRNKVNSYLTTDLSEEEQKARETWVCYYCGENTYDVDYEYIGSCTNHLGCELKAENDRKPYINDNVDETDKDKKVDWFDDDDLIIGVANEEKVFSNVQKQVYNEMTSDGLPSGGDAQAVLESHKLAEEIVDNQDEKWIYESPDSGKTVFRRPFGDYDMKNKEEINWETKEPTGRKFTDYPFK